MLARDNRHIDRLNLVLNFAHIHWDEELSLDLLADIACLSKCHFIKVFHEYTGETPMSFLKRIRLENAAHWLTDSRELTITDIALNCGFASNQTFTRAFQNKFSNSPRQFRSTYFENLEQALETSRANRYADRFHIGDGEEDMTREASRIKLVQRPPVSGLYSEHR